MKSVKKLPLQDHPWVQKPSLQTLFSILNSDALNARMVGGCVRDSLLKREITDIDLACSLPPEKTIIRLEKAGIKVIPTGLKHGTVTAIINSTHFEITTLRRDEETFGRHAKVAYTDNWIDDAVRRDFTFNALYLDGDGSLYDPCNGLVDLKERKVRFIGNADQRIQEDALRILRFFRFGAQIGGGKLDETGLKSCIDNKNKIDGLSGERIAQELFKLLNADDVISIMNIMAETGVLSHIIPNYKNMARFNDYVALEIKLKRCDKLARLSCLLLGDPKVIGMRLKLSNKQVDILRRYQQSQINLSNSTSQKEIRHMIYQYGRDVYVNKLLSTWAAKPDVGAYSEMLKYAEKWSIPSFPLFGRDLISMGYAAGADLGRTLKTLEEKWIKSDFSLSKNDLINLAKATLTD